MRGDSLRDFYAKALALVGLGALASVGALVDYWPGKVEVPHVTGAAAASSAPVRLLAQDLSPIAPPASRPVRRYAPVASTTPVPTVAPVIDSQDFDQQSDDAVADTNAIPSSANAVPLQLDMMPVGAWTMPATALELSVPTPTWVVSASLDDDAEQSAFAGSPMPQSPAAPSYEGISGVLRKTGSSIATIGVKTGSTIFGAFRAVGSAFRKIL